MTEDGLAAMEEMNEYLARVSADQRANPPKVPNAISRLREHRNADGAALSDSVARIDEMMAMIGGDG